MISNRLTYIIAFLLIASAFTLCLISLYNDCWTFDETAHIAAGYSYLTKQDYRLNPEHPPLIKDLAALPLLFLNLNFPENHSSWTQEKEPVWWLQFDFARQFLYESGNNPDKILLFARLPMILLFLFLAWFIFFWTKKLFNNKTALLSLFLISFSPNFLAHGRLVTTDVGAALGAVLATYFWLKFLKKPSWKNILLSALILGISLLFKFSLLLLLPFLIIITLFYIWIHKLPLIKYTSFSILIGLVALIFVIWPIYQVHTFNYPIEQQVKDNAFQLNSTSIPEPLLKPFLWMSHQPALRSINHYFTGVLMALGRTAGGNTTFFLGQISAKSWKTYFPLVYLIKLPLSFLILILLALIWSFSFLFNKKNRNFKLRIKKWASEHFTELSMLIFLIIYWSVSIRSNLNIGIRHLLPIFPFTIILVSRATVSWLKDPFLKVKYIFLGFLILWQVISVILICPYFISYFNELIGGAKNGYKYVTDSNLDWGQDLKRLSLFVKEKKINKIYLNYFGGGSPAYYLGNKYYPWDAKQSPVQLPPNSWLAVSANELQGGRAIPVKGFDQKSDYYQWLNKYEPVKIIGHSIFVYYID